MKRLLFAVFVFALGFATLTGCDSNTKKDDGITVKDLKNRGKPAEGKH